MYISIYLYKLYMSSRFILNRSQKQNIKYRIESIDEFE